MSVLKSMFHKNYEEMDEPIMEVKDKENSTLRSEYVVMGVTTRQTLTLRFIDDGVQVYIHGEDGISLVESVHFKYIKSVSVMSKNVVAIDWNRGPYHTHDVSRFITNNAEAKQIRDKFYLNLRILSNKIL